MAAKDAYYRADDGKFRYIVTGAETDPGNDGNMMIYRRTELETAACPHRYKTEDRRISSGVANRGQVNHAIIREYINHLFMMEKAADFDAAIAIRDRHLQATVLEPALRDQVHDGIATFASNFHLSLDRYLAHEERVLSIPLRFTCQIDLVYARGGIATGATAPSVPAMDPDSEIEIVDWKSFPGSFVGNVFEYFQARAYIVAAARRWPGYSNYRFTFHSLAGQQSTAVINVGQVPIWESEITSRRKWIESHEKDGSWPAMPGLVCQYCTAKCPIVPLAADDDEGAAFRVISGLEAVEAADGVLALQRAVKRRQDALRAWCKVNGEVVHGDGELVTGYRPVKRRWLTFNDLATVTSEENVLPENVEIAASKLKGMVKGDGKCAVRLRKAISEKVGHRFQTWKAGSVAGDE